MVSLSKRRRTSFFGQPFCNVVFFLVHACDCFFCFLDFLGHFSGPIVASRENVHYTCVSLWAVYRIARGLGTRCDLLWVWNRWLCFFQVTPSFFCLSAIVSSRIGHTRGRSQNGFFQQSVSSEGFSDLCCIVVDHIF